MQILGDSIEQLGFFTAGLNNLRNLLSANFNNSKLCGYEESVQSDEKYDKK